MMITQTEDRTAARLRARGFTTHDARTFTGTIVRLPGGRTAHVMVVDNAYRGSVMHARQATRLFTGLNFPQLVAFLSQF